MDDTILIYTTLIMALGSLVLSASNCLFNKAKQKQSEPVIKECKTPFYLDENGKLCRNTKLQPRNCKYTESFINTGYDE